MGRLNIKWWMVVWLMVVCVMVYVFGVDLCLCEVV